MKSHEEIQKENEILRKYLFVKITMPEWLVGHVHQNVNSFSSKILTLDPAYSLYEFVVLASYKTFDELQKFIGETIDVSMRVLSPNDDLLNRAQTCLGSSLLR